MIEVSQEGVVKSSQNLWIMTKDPFLINDSDILKFGQIEY